MWLSVWLRLVTASSFWWWEEGWVEFSSSTDKCWMREEVGEGESVWGEWLLHKLEEGEDEEKDLLSSWSNLPDLLSRLSCWSNLSWCLCFLSCS